MTETTSAAPSRKIKRYGWRPDIPDHRDHLFAVAPAILKDLPPSADLRPNCPPVYDQGELGSCTANAIGSAVEYDLKKQGQPDFTPSRLFIYYNERVIEGTVGEDAGAMIRDGIRSLNRQGVCPETVWPYDIARFTRKPPAAAYKQALACRAVQYARVSRDLAQMRGCIASGFPFVLGFTVYSAFESQDVARTGTLDLPASGEEVMGGHAVKAVGYDDATQRFTIKNSWGAAWGQQGYFTMPYAYLLNPHLSSDFWVVRMLSAASDPQALAA